MVQPISILLSVKTESDHTDNDLGEAKDSVRENHLLLSAGAGEEVVHFEGERRTSLFRATMTGRTILMNDRRDRPWNEEEWVCILC